MTNRPVNIYGTGLGTNGSDRVSVGTKHLYDGHNRRVKSVDEDGRARYNIFDAAGTLIQVYDAHTDTRTDYVSGPNGPLARIKRIAGVDTVSFTHADHLGTARAGTSATGALLWEDFHTPFGESLIHPDATDDQGDFTGHIRDKSSGLTYMQARYYSPVAGQFLSIDPMDFVGSGGNPGYFNRYAYTFNDPINMIDPDGQVVRGAGFQSDTDPEWVDAKNAAREASTRASTEAGNYTHLANSIKSGNWDQRASDAKSEFSKAYGTGNYNEANVSAVASALTDIANTLSASSSTVIDRADAAKMAQYGFGAGTGGFFEPSSGKIYTTDNFHAAGFESQVFKMFHEGGHATGGNHIPAANGPQGGYTSGRLYRIKARTYWNSNSASKQYSDPGILDCVVQVGAGGC